MTAPRISYRLIARRVVGGASLVLLAGLPSRPAAAQFNFVTLAVGFSPNPTVLRGTGGGDRPAEEIVQTSRSLTGPCLGYISATPHEEVTLESRFAKLEMRVESDLDTTLIIEGPDGVWCNDDSGSQNPAISGAWVPGSYRVWIGAYQPQQMPEYDFYITDNS